MPLTGGKRSLQVSFTEANSQIMELDVAFIAVLPVLSERVRKGVGRSQESSSRFVLPLFLDGDVAQVCDSARGAGGQLCHVAIHLYGRGGLRKRGRAQKAGDRRRVKHMRMSVHISNFRSAVKRVFNCSWLPDLT